MNLYEIKKVGNEYHVIDVRDEIKSTYPTEEDAKEAAFHYEAYERVKEMTMFALFDLYEENIKTTTHKNIVEAMESALAKVDNHIRIK